MIFNHLFVFLLKCLIQFKIQKNYNFCLLFIGCCKKFASFCSSVYLRKRLKSKDFRENHDIQSPTHSLRYFDDCLSRQDGINCRCNHLYSGERGEILHLEQYVDGEASHFFRRLEWDLQGFMIPMDQFENRFQELIATQFDMSYRLLFSKEDRRPSLKRQMHFYILATLLLFVSAEVSCGSAPKQKAPVNNISGGEASTVIPKIRLQVIAEGLSQPLALLPAGDGSGRLFIVEQSGRVLILKGRKVSNLPFLDIQNRVTSGGEKGLLGLAFHPDFATNRRLFVNYTESKNGLKTIISEFTANKQLNRVDPASERKILIIAQPFRNHNGGQIAFGPDGYLYIGMGDGGSGNDPRENGQKLSTLLGKMLRIDIDRKENGKQYAIPPDNPYTTQSKIAPEIWAYGFRNPWRFSFDARSGDLYAGDVGQNHREEIDLVERGGNYGWRIMEGSLCTPGVSTACDKSKFQAPLFDYARSEGTVVIGGYVYRGTSIPGLAGAYLFGDFAVGRIWMFRLKEGKARDHRLLLESGRPISAFGEDEKQELYIVDYSGKILKIVPEHIKNPLP